MVRRFLCPLIAIVLAAVVVSKFNKELLRHILFTTRNALRALAQVNLSVMSCGRKNKHNGLYRFLLIGEV